MSSALVSLTDGNFVAEVEQASGLVLVDFAAAWCGPCKMIAPILEAAASKYAGQAKIGKIDVDANPGIPGKYGVRSLPTVVFFKDGAEVERLVGAFSRGALEQAIQAWI